MLCYLTNDDLLTFLQKCKANLKDENSLIIVKENIHDSSYEFDQVDSSVVRSNAIFEGIFKKAGLRVVKH